MACTPPRSGCPISVALDLLGDKWSLLVIRDLIFGGKRQFGEFLESPERMSTNVLADRLERLVAAGLATREVDPANRRRVLYGVTDKGLDLIPVLLELMVWSGRHEETAASPAYLRRLRRERGKVERELRARVARG
jgi:DNA-binding HxlR family transcriptional regulator